MMHDFTLDEVDIASPTTSYTGYATRIRFAARSSSCNDRRSRDRYPKAESGGEKGEDPVRRVSIIGRSQPGRCLPCWCLWRACKGWYWIGLDSEFSGLVDSMVFVYCCSHAGRRCTPRTRVFVCACMDKTNGPFPGRSLLATLCCTHWWNKGLWSRFIWAIGLGF
jgi:hypothetical protein